MEIPLKGNVKETSLVKVLVQLNRNRKTGTLSLKTAAFTKKIFINHGDAIFASSTFEDDRLGEMLLKADKISLEQYEKSVQMLKSSRKRQGAILVELGYITPKDLFWGVKYQVREIIHSMFQVEDGEYEFSEGDIPLQEVITIKLSMGNLIYEGVRRIENWTRIRNEMPSVDSALKLSDDPLSLFQEIELAAEDKKILLMIDGKKTIKEVIEHARTGSFEALKILYVLWSIGIIEHRALSDNETQEEKSVSLEEILQPPSEEEALLQKRIDSLYGRLEHLSPFELLEVDETAGDEGIKKNYYRLAREFHPDRYFSIADDSFRSKLTAIFDAIAKAYNAVKDEKQRRLYSASAGSVEDQETGKSANADEQFRRGIGEFKAGNYWGAVENFRWATRLMPDNATYWNHLSLAYSRMPGRIKDAEEALLAAVKLEPHNPDYHANLGLLYLKAGLRKRARSNFEKALQLDTRNEKAQKGMKQTQE